MKVTKNIKSRFSILLLSIVSMLLLVGCAGMGTTGSKYMNEHTFQAKYDINIQEATDIAEQAFGVMEVRLMKKNAASGFLSGVLTTGFWVNKETFFIEVYISTPGKNQVKIHATTVAGPQTAFTNELDDIVENFYKAFEQKLSSSR